MMDPPNESAWCEISPAQISQNLRHTLDRLPAQTRLCAVIKADAYGHGIENVVPALLAQGVRHIGISANSEARAVRAAGFTGAILRLRTATPEEVEDALSYNVQELIGSVGGMQAILNQLGARGLPPVHLSLNAGGMSRDGVELSTQQGRTDCGRILELGAERIVGLCTHFPSNSSDELADNITRFQQDLAWVFANSSLRREEILTHAGSTLTLAAGQDPKVDMMRCGAILFGIAGAGPEFRPAMQLKSRVISLGTYPKGSTVGYDRTCVLPDDRLLASVAMGYANGYSRQMSKGAQVLIRGQICPVMGAISMNTLVVDVTEVPGVAIGDEVVAFGPQGGCEIGAAAIEEGSGTILADLFSDWGQRNPRLTKDPKDLVCGQIV
ncbi:MAG: alanine racemase [Roseobacter sp. MedPE-SWde]|nr:MAG: alanine racemase [Roseobacter sp. MedPE-SWde]